MIPDRSFAERNLLLLKLVKTMNEKDEDGNKKGLAGMLKENNVEDLYEKGFLRGDDLSAFILAAFNESDEVTKEEKEEKEEKIDFKEILEDLGSKGGALEVLLKRAISNRVLGKYITLPDSSSEVKKISPVQKMNALINVLRKAVGHKEVQEADGSNMAFVRKSFENWGDTVKTKSIRTFIPKTKVGICNLVKWASSKGLRVRASGYRHSWSNITVDDDQVLVSMLPLPKAENVPTFVSEIDEDSDLQGIKELDKFVEEDGIKKRLFKIGASTTNEQFRVWVKKNSFDQDTGKYSKPWWTIPLNVILVEITFGGSNAPICHGAGLKTKTLSDLVVGIELVNAKGEIQIIDDPVQLKSASGCFGMLGIITSLTLKLDPLTFANMVPINKRLALTIPPPVGFHVPDGIDMRGITSRAISEAYEDFKYRCENHYYVEYFWFPNQRDCWVNTWENNGNMTDAEEYPTPGAAKLQSFGTLASDTLNNEFFGKYPASFQTNFMSSLAMFGLPQRTKDNPIVTPLIDALHFQRGIHNMRCNDMEWEIPIPGLKSDPSKPDWSVVQKAWWAAIEIWYRRFNKDKDDIPMRLPLELRITGASDVNLAPQYGNKHGTCSIEVLTQSNVDKKDWEDYCQEITDAWLSLKYDDGTPIHPFRNEDGFEVYVRPHWAKEWEFLKVKGKPIKNYLREDACKAQIKLYRDGLKAVAKSGGYSIEDADKMFSTAIAEEMFINTKSTSPSSAKCSDCSIM